MSQKEKNILQKNIQKKKQKDKFMRQIQFLQLVLCQNWTIKNAAAQSKIKFVTAKVVLKKFRQLGYIKNSEKDYKNKIELLREQAFIKSQIQQEKKEKREQEFKILSKKIQSTEQFPQQNETQNEQDLNFQIEILKKDIEYQKQIQFELLTSVLKEQIKLMISNKIYV